MSISSPSDGKVIPPPNDDVESRRVGAANETSLAFIGGRRHSWMQSGSTLPPVVRTHATGIRKKKQPSKTLAKNIPLRTIIKDNMTPEQNQAQGLKVSGEAAEALNTSRDDTLVFSPSPTEAASILVNPHESIRSENSQTASSNTPPSTELGGLQDEVVEQSAAQETLVDGACAMSPTATQQPHQVQGSPCQNSSSSASTPANTPMRPPHQDGTWDKPTRQVPNQIMVGGSVYQLVNPVPPPSPNAHVPSRTNPTPSFSGGVSHNTYPASQLPQHAIGMDQGSLTVWHQMLIDYVNGPSGPDRQTSSIEEWRCSTLMCACSNNDSFFICLHQFYCLWSTDRQFLHSILPLGSRVFNMAFELLNPVLKPNKLLKQHHLSWLAYFPFNHQYPTSLYGAFEEVSSQVVKFLSSFSQRWSTMMNSVRNRGYPLMVKELTEVLDCPSTLLQTMLFTLSWSALATNNGAIARQSAHIFQEDKVNEAQATNYTGPQIFQARHNIKQKYGAIINQWVCQTNIAETARLAAARGQSNSTVNLQPHTAGTTATLASFPFNSLSGGFSSPHSASGSRLPLGHGHSINASRPTPYPATSQLQRISTDVPVRHFISQREENSSYQHTIQLQNHFSQYRGIPPYTSRSYNPNLPRVQQPSQATEHEFSRQERQPRNRAAAADAQTRMAPMRHRTITGDRFATAPLGRAERPQSPYDWTSVQSGLHLVRSRSPMRVSAGVSGVRYYQFLDRFAIEPTILLPNKGTIQVFDFTVTAAEFADISQAVCAEDIRIHKFRQGTLRYRLKLIGELPKNKTTDIADWATSTCVWPPEIYCIFNGEPVFPRRPQHFHQHLPIELTEMVQQGFNTVKISLPQTADNYKTVSTYHLAVEVLNTMDHESTLGLVNELDKTSADQTRGEISRRLRPSDSDDLIVQDDSLCISLMDPFSARMVEYPVRGMRCKHVECFDLLIWLQTRRGKPSQSLSEPALADGWKCPICGQDAGPRSLRFDEYFTEIRKALVEADKVQTKSIKVTMDGNWTANEEEKDEDDDEANHSSVTTMAQTRAEPDVIEILDD